MRHIPFVLVGAATVGLLSTANASANAIYQWHSTSPGPYVTATGGELEFTNAAYFSGAVDFHVNDYFNNPETSPWIKYGDFPDDRIINSPVISASFTLALTQGGWVPWMSSYPGSLYFADQQFPFGSTLTFNNDGTLTGSLFIYDESDEANAAGMDYNWSVFNYGSDYFGGGECGPPTCDAGSGYWQLARVTVPEPPIWPLLGLGTIGLVGMFRRRRDACMAKPHASLRGSGTTLKEW